MLFGLKSLCLVHGAIPSGEILRMLGRLDMPNLGHLHLGSDVDRVSAFFNMLTIPTSKSLSLQCSIDSFGDSQCTIIQSVARHFTAVLAAGDFFTHISATMSPYRTNIVCNTPNGLATTLRPWTSLSISLAGHGSSLPDPPFLNSVLNNFIWDACTLLPLNGCNQTLQLNSVFYDEVTWQNAVSTLHGVSTLMLSYGAALMLLEHMSTIRESSGGSPEESSPTSPTPLFLFLDEIRIESSTWSRDALLSKGSVIEILRSELAARQRLFTVYFNDEKVDFD